MAVRMFAYYNIIYIDDRILRCFMVILVAMQYNMYLRAFNACLVDSFGHSAAAVPLSVCVCMHERYIVEYKRVISVITINKVFMMGYW